MQPGCPAVPAVTQVGECSHPRVSQSGQGSTMPSTTAPRALISLPVSGRSETRAVTRPESDSAAGPILRRPGSRGGGAEAGRGPCEAGSLREAQPRGGPAGGGEVAGPGGARRAAATASRAVRPAWRPWVKRRRSQVREFIPRGPRARVLGVVGSRVVGEAHPGLAFGQDLTQRSGTCFQGPGKGSRS